MNLLSTLVLILLTLVGYSSGRVLSRYRLQVTPGILDILLVFVLWVGALWTREGLGGGWALLVWFLAGGVVGLLTSTLLRDGLPVNRSAIIATSPLSRAWESWKAFAQVTGDFQSRMLMIWFYILIVTPFGLVIRFTADPLRIRKTTLTSFWQDMPPAQTKIDDARKQY